MKIVKVPQLPWHGPKNLDLAFPDTWQVEVAHIAGAEKPALSPDEIKKAIIHPIGTAPIREAARGKKEAVIIFDDMARVTRVAKITPFILEELNVAGVGDAHIRFVAALGLHGVMNRTDFVRKLGEDIVSRFPCFNHNPFTNCMPVGTTSTFGTKVSVNEEVMKCEYKIAIGSVVPHPAAGFGGGTKIILPGVTSFETTEHNHRKSVEAAAAAIKNPQSQQKARIGMGLFDENPVPRDSDEAAKLAGLDFMVNALINKWGESIALFSGEPTAARNAAVKEAKSHYAAPKVKEKDIAIANTFAKSNEALLALFAAFPSVKTTGGADVIIITNAPDGQVPHYLIGSWGTMSFGKLYPRLSVPPFINHIIVFNEYPHPGSRWLEPGEKIVYLSRWEDVLTLLQKTHGSETSVVVYPSADIQC